MKEQVEDYQINILRCCVLLTTLFAISDEIHPSFDIIHHLIYIYIQTVYLWTNVFKYEYTFLTKTQYHYIKFVQPKYSYKTNTIDYNIIFQIWQKKGISLTLIIKTFPCFSPNSGPAIMYTFSDVLASKYAFPIDNSPLCPLRRTGGIHWYRSHAPLVLRPITSAVHRYYLTSYVGVGTRGPCTYL